MRWEKSALQIQLEKEGWDFVSNALVGQFGEPRTNEHLEEVYRQRGYSDVLIQNIAFGCDGKPLKGRDWRAVYAKEA